MFTFAVVSARPGRVIPPPILDRLHNPNPADVPFDAAHHVVWHDRSRSVWFAAWQAEDRLGIGPRWAVRQGGVTAFGGSTWFRSTPWNRSAPWAEQLADLFAERPLATIAPELEGIFTAVSIDADGVGCVTADPLGMSILVRSTGDGVVVASNRAEVAAHLATGRDQPSRDLEAAGLLIYGSTLAGGRTGFEDVRRVPEGSILRLGPGRPLDVETWDPTPWLDGTDLSSADIGDVAADVGDHLRALVRACSTVPSWSRTFELTGGHDSRLLLALLVEQGLTHEFTYLTWGSADLPDVTIARQLAERYDLHHRAAGGLPLRSGPRPPALAGPVPAVPPNSPGARLASLSAAGGGRAPSFEDRLRHHVWATSGARSLWDQIRPSTRLQPSMSVCGIFGELLRSVSSDARGFVGPDDVRTHVLGGGLHGDPALLLHRDVRRSYDEAMIAQVTDLMAGGGPGADALDGHYIRTRLREWFGTGAEHDSWNRIYPLYSLPAIRASFSLGTERRAREELAFALVRAADEDLARSPFAGAGWPEPTIAGLPGRYPSTPMSPAGSPSHDAVRRRSARFRPAAGWKRWIPGVEATQEPRRSIHVAEARFKEAGDNLSVLHQFLDLSPSHQLFDLVDRKRVQRSLENVADLSYYRGRAIYDLVTAAIWLDGAEAPFKPAE